MFFHLKNRLRNLTYRNNFIKSIYLLANGIKVKLLSCLSDELFAKLNYKENTGETLNLDNPETFNEKLWWLKLNNRDPLLTVCSDKYKVRDYIREKGLAHILTKLYGVYDNADDIDFGKLPDRAFIKTNHRSGANIIWDRNNPFDHNKFRKRFNKALKSNYYWQSREWNYKNIEPKLLVEEMLEDKENKSLIDYKFLCFDGVPHYCWVDIGRFSDHRRNVYDIDWKLQNFRVKLKNTDFDIEKPANFAEMIRIATELSKGFSHIRVDLYNVNGKIYFGELTFTNGNGFDPIYPEEFDIHLGNLWNLPINK